MDEPGNRNLWSAEKENIPSAMESAENVPPPPPEVKIRTFRSDLESMAASGGGAPTFKTVAAPGLVRGDDQENKPVSGGGSGKFWTTAIVIIAIGILIGIGFLAYNLFPPNTSTAPQAQTPGASQQQKNPVPAPSAASEFVTRTFFVKPVDQVLSLALSKTVTSASDLQTFNQKLKGVLAGASATSTFFEVDVKDSGGNQLGLNDVFSAADLSFLDQQFFLEHFSPYVTVFVYRDKNGFWPGYVLQLKPTENWLFIQPDIAKIESSAKLSNFFLNQTGSRSADGFKDTTISSTTARELDFSAPGASFVYLWSRGYFVLSSSADGTKEALARL